MPSRRSGPRRTELAAQWPGWSMVLTSSRRLALRSKFVAEAGRGACKWSRRVSSSARGAARQCSTSTCVRSCNPDQSAVPSGDAYKRFAGVLVLGWAGPESPGRRLQWAFRKRWHAVLRLDRQKSAKSPLGRVAPGSAFGYRQRRLLAFLLRMANRWASRPEVNGEAVAPDAAPQCRF